MQLVRLSSQPSTPDTEPATCLNNTPDTSANGRFSDRRKRIARRTERDAFRRIVMPALYVVGLIGVVVFCAIAVYAALTGVDIRPFAVIAVAPTLLIGVMEAYRLVRGHHSDSLEEP